MSTDHEQDRRQINQWIIDNQICDLSKCAATTMMCSKYRSAYNCGCVPCDLWKADQMHKLLIGE